MFCPECGIENDVDKSYCRRCGKALAAVRLALDGRIDQAIKLVKKDQSKIYYSVRIGVCVFLVLVSIATIFSRGWFGFSNLQSAAVILIIMLLLFMQSVHKSRLVARLLNTETRAAHLNSSTTTAAQALNKPTNVTASVLAQDASVTEQDTLKLKS